MQLLRAIGVLSLVLLLVVAGSSQFTTAQVAGGAFVVALNVAQEVPAPSVSGDLSPGGTGVFVLNNLGTDLGFAITFSGLTGSPSLMHFHNAEQGTAGGVVQTICGAPPPAILGDCPSGSSGTIAGVWEDIPSDLLQELLAGNIYVNIHTGANGAGEVRGQIR